MNELTILEFLSLLAVLTAVVLAIVVYARGDALSSRPGAHETRDRDGLRPPADHDRDRVSRAA